MPSPIFAKQIQIMKQNKLQKKIQEQHASPRKESAVRARMLQGELTAKIRRDIGFSKLTLFVNKI